MRRSPCLAFLLDLLRKSVLETLVLRPVQLDTSCVLARDHLHRQREVVSGPQLVCEPSDAVSVFSSLMLMAGHGAHAIGPHRARLGDGASQISVKLRAVASGNVVRV